MTVDSWARCTEAVRREGGEMLIQLWHEGALRSDGDGQTLSPSGIAYPGKEQGRPATRSDLEQVREGFVRSAVLAQKAGATGVELHCAHGYFLDQLLWPAVNLRDDEYGGPDPQNRARLPAEIIACIRDVCGPDFLISVRFSQWKEHAYRARIADTPEDLQTIVLAFRAAGASILHASTRRFWVPEWPEQDWSVAGWARHFSSLPTITVGSVGLSKDVMETFTTQGSLTNTIAASVGELARRFSAGEFDLVSIGRSLIADPDWVKKVQAGEYDTIRLFRKEDLGSLHWDG
jgi:2,4-dienoyl-CoA reductase-like NADH-dependent reductase (Old Yellow Enzyme family)